MRPCPTIINSGRGIYGSTYTSIVPPQGIPTPKISSSRSRGTIRVWPSRILSREASRTASSAQPPPTQPNTVCPLLSIIDFAPGLAETDPVILITVATANGTSAALNSANFSKYSLNIFYRFASSKIIGSDSARTYCSAMASSVIES